MSADGRNMKTLTQTTITYCNIHTVNKDEMAVEVQIVLEEKSNTRTREELELTQLRDFCYKSFVDKLQNVIVFWLNNCSN
jgi:hypothetical protein